MSSRLQLFSFTLAGDSFAFGVEQMAGRLSVKLFCRRQGEGGLLLSELSPDLPRKTCTGMEWSWIIKKVQQYI